MTVHRDASRKPWAVCAAVTQEMLNDLVLFAVGAGIPMEPVTTDVALPAMGDVRLKVALTITGATFDLRADDGGRARVVVNAAGDVAAEAIGFEGSAMPMAGMLPSSPVPIPVRVEALVDPVVDLRPDGTVEAGLALAGAELVGVSVDDDAPVPDGVDPETWTPMTQMVNMLFGSMGAQLFAALGEHVPVAGTELGPEVGEVLERLGVATGRADVSIATGLLTIGLPARSGVSGRAAPVPVGGKRVAVSLAGTGVHELAGLLLARAASGMPLPFEMQVDLSDERVGSTLRQTRILSDRVPDLRLALRTDLRPRLVRGRLEVAVDAAWLELPPMFGFVNDLSRRLGGLASLAPLRLRFPPVIQVPVGDGGDTIGIEVDDLRVTADGIGVVVGLA